MTSIDWTGRRAQHMLGDGELYLNTASFGSLHRRTFEAHVEMLRQYELSPTMNHSDCWRRTDAGREPTAYARERMEGTGWAGCITGAEPRPLPQARTAYAVDGMGDLDRRQELYDRWRITTPAGKRESDHWLRISTHCYNDRWEIDRLIEGLETLQVSS